MLLIKNGTIITAADTFAADILVENGKILSLEKALDASFSSQADEVIDASRKLILPGGVDAHTHFDLPMFGTVSSDDHYTGLKAAAFGGTTTVIDFVPMLPGSDNGGSKSVLKKSVEIWLEKAAKAAVDYSFHMNLTRYDDEIEARIPGLLEMGITTLKVFTAYNNRLRLDDGNIFRALRVAKENGMLVMAHCENGDVIETLVNEALLAKHLTPEWHARTRPAWGAVGATLRMASLAAQADASIYIVHMNVGGEVDMLKYARERGVRAMGETCPQYLFFTKADLSQPDGAKWVCSPPVRSVQDNARLWVGLADGTLQTIATDHCPFFYDGNKPILYEGKEIAIPGKELGVNDFTLIPNGLPAVGDRLPILWTYGVSAGKITANQFVALNSTNPARIFGLYPQKGAIQPGADADLVIWDPYKKVKYGVALAQHRTDYNLFEGWDLTGYPEKVFLRGKMIVDNSRWLGRPGMGQFIKRKSGAEIL
ncbi:MAG: dihydropyrimidinase [Chloroflexi bacterium GWB2_49_20]|nr:MAG: dihydropyrimidinase [Chloroflexi bacterium GWB2_49_20]OGN77633.1 MAG: dihydropyrimidinase [Chloroflexi bacterium GWC2_49_37]OGN86409.1 MAG: dihydropyrimidinase [Chloroflexi bacterium GWD2_49_16]HBG74647.1 dihydropyrimidinase [Anaerolineae bacterium]